MGTHGAPSTVTSTGSTLGCRAPSRGAAPDHGYLLGTGTRGLSRRIAEQLSAWGPSGTATAAPQCPATSPGETTRCGHRGGEGDEHPTRLQRLSHACTSAHPRSSGTGRQHPGFGTPPPSRDARLRAAPASPHRGRLPFLGSRPRAPRSQAGSASPPPPHRGSPAAVAPSCARRAPGSPRSAPASPPPPSGGQKARGTLLLPIPEAPAGHRSRNHPGGFPRGSRLFPTGTGHPPGEFPGPSRVTPAPAGPGLSSWQHPPAPASPSSAPGCPSVPTPQRGAGGSCEGQGRAGHIAAGHVAGLPSSRRQPPAEHPRLSRSPLLSSRHRELREGPAGQS